MENKKMVDVRVGWIAEANGCKKNEVNDKSGWSQEQNDWLLELVAKRGMVVEGGGKNVHNNWQIDCEKHG